MRTIFTTGQVAKICKVAPRTVSKWFDSGRLRGYRIPGSSDRRIPREHLIRFLKEHGMPLGELANEGNVHIVFVSSCEETRSSFQEFADQSEYVFVHSVTNGFDAGIAMQTHDASCIVIDSSSDPDAALTLAQHIKDNPDYERVVRVALMDENAILQSFGEEVLHETFRKPFDIALLVERIRTLTKRASELATA